jgi:hypothetical protein
MQRVVFKNQCGALRIRQTTLDQGQIQILVAAVEFVADNRMANVRKVDAYLMFAAGARFDAEQSEIFHNARKFSFDPEFRLRQRAIRTHAIFDRNATGFISSQWRINDPLLRRDMAVDNGQIFLFDGAAFENFSHLARDFGIFCDDDHTAGFAVKPIHQMRLRGISQMQPHTANQTGHLAILRRMADKAGGLVDDQQVVVLENDFKKFFHRLFSRQAGVSCPPVKEKWHRWLPLMFVALFALSRIPGLLPWNFSAAYAFAFCAGVYFPRKNSGWLPLLVLLATDLGLNFYYQYKNPDYDVWSFSNLANLGFNYVAYTVLIFLGRSFKPKSSFVALLGGGIFGAILFYLITNTASWFFNPFHNPEYATSFSGWLLALTRGIGGYPSTWEFFRNTLLSGGLFTALFVAAAKLTAPAESPADKKAGAREEEAETEEKAKEANA